MTVDSPRAVGARDRVTGAVPWGTVLSTAAVMAYGDGFVMVALRGAFGAVERAGHPLVSWLVESTLAAPVYALVVLEVLARTQRRSAPVLTAARAVVRTTVQLAFAGSVVGLAWLAATAAYDYRLQTVLGQHMSSMRSAGVAGCGVTDCAGLQQNATFGVQIESVTIGIALMLAANVLLVGWLVALRGGRLRAAGNVLRATRPVRRADAIRTLVAVGLLATAGVHVASVLGGRSGGFVVVVLVGSEIIVGVSLLVTRPDPRAGWTTTVALVSATPLLLWLIAHTVGPSSGWPAPAGAGVPGLVAAALEIVTLAGVVVLIRAAGWSRRPRAGTPHDRALVVLCVVALASVGVTATTPAWTVDLGTVVHRADH